MKQQNLYLMCGLPGSGKSTWVCKMLVNTESRWISRDAIRFGMVKENESYFSKEAQVFNTFIDKINCAIASGTPDIYVDATHLTKNARMKVLKRLNNLDNVNIIPVNFIIPVDTCIERNNNREGRAIVPDTVIREMAKAFKPAELDEYEYDHIITIEEEE